MGDTLARRKETTPTLPVDVLQPTGPAVKMDLSPDIRGIGGSPVSDAIPTTQLPTGVLPRGDALPPAQVQPEELPVVTAQTVAAQHPDKKVTVEDVIGLFPKNLGPGKWREAKAVLEKEKQESK